MTVEELITKLKKYPPAAKIVVKGYENGYNDIDEVKNVLISIQKDSKWWDGFYENRRWRRFKLLHC